MLGWLALIVPLATSVVFFLLGKDLPAARRVFASVHGVVAIAILPVTMFAVAMLPNIGETGGTIIMLAVGAIAGTSVFYAIASVKTRWYFHLLHVPTFAVIAGGFVYAAFFLSGR